MEEDSGSITACLGMLRRGDRAAAQELWARYFQRLVGLARARLRSTSRRVADEEDVALSAFDSFYRRAEAGSFPRLEDRDDLWQILFVLTARKAVNQAQHDGRARRGGGRVSTLADLADWRIEEVLSDEPSPDLAAQLDEECRLRLDRLSDPELRQVALWKLEGFTNQEVADRLGCIVQTVERKLRRIRGLWAVGDDTEAAP